MQFSQPMKPKITYIISDTHKAVFFENTALGLREKGIELSFILINSEHTELSLFLEKNHFETYHLHVKSLARSFKQILQCRSILQKIQADTVHCHISTANWVGLWAARFAFVKQIIYTRHSGEPLVHTFKERLIDQFQNILATKIVAISTNIKDILLRQGVTENKIILINHGFDLARMLNPDPAEVLRIKNTYNPGNQFPVVGVVARWLELKGIQYIIPAFIELLTKYPDAKLCMFNASEHAEYGKEIKNLLSAIPARNYEAVVFENNVFDLYHLFDLYIHVPVNPDCEAFGQTYIESLAAGIPSIFTLSGIAREFIIDQENALVVDYKNSAEIHEAILLLLDNKLLRDKLTIKGKQNMQERFGLPVYLKKLIQLYTH